MARLRFGRPISLRWNGLLLEGPANTVFEIPDEYYEEFNQDIAPVEPTIVWLDTDEGATLRGRVTALETSGTATANLAAAALPQANWTSSQFANGYTSVPNLPYWAITTAAGTTSGTVRHVRLVPYKNITVSNISFVTGNTTASSGLTLARFGIYTRSGTTFTLVARTASDTTIGNALNTKYTRALDTTGGYPSTYAMTAGTEYYVSVIQVGTTMSPWVASTVLQSVVPTIFGGGRPSYLQSGQTDLPTSSTGVVDNNSVFVEVS